MEFQKIINLLENETTQSSTFRIKNWVEIKNDRHEGYNKNNFKMCY